MTEQERNELLKQIRQIVREELAAKPPTKGFNVDAKVKELRERFS